MIKVNSPLISQNAYKYIKDCLKSGWVSSGGPYIERFEKAFSSYLGVKFSVTTSSGTSALHLAIAALGIGKGDEVIVPDLTIISCALVVLYTGATPVFVDVEAQTGNIDPTKIEQKITKKTKAILMVHLYGHPGDIDPIKALAKKYKLYLIEDGAQAHGAEYKGRKVGSLADIGCFSFYGNKIITTGEGGMVVTNNQKIYQRLKSLKDLAHSPKKRFLHYQIGFSYRMTNLQAALGLAQLEEVEKFIQKKLWIANEYNNRLKKLSILELPIEQPWAKNVYWMYAVRVKEGSRISRNKLIKELEKMGVETREFFIPLHKQPVFLPFGFLDDTKYPVSLDLSRRGLYLPSGLAITQRQINSVIAKIQKIAKYESI